MSAYSDKDIESINSTLEKLNGIENYVPALMPDAPLVANRMMMIPINVVSMISLSNEADLGVKSNLKTGPLLAVIAVNYAALLEDKHPNALEVAVLRGLIASRGVLFDGPAPTKLGKAFARYTKREEIFIVNRPDGLDWDNKGNVTKLDPKYHPITDAFGVTITDDFTKMTTLLPIFAAIEFQKTNHHYIDNDYYKTSYGKHFKSAQLADLESRWNRASIIYDAVHWMGPYAMEVYKSNLVNSKKGLVPRGIVIKSNPAPAGTALCRTQIAVWRAIGVYPGGSELVNYYEAHIRKMNALSVAIDKDRLSYHVYAGLYNKLSKLETEIVSDTMASCGQLAAIAQAFIETVARGTDLARAKALKKHADQNIALFRMAQAAFRGTLRKIEREQTFSAVLAALKKDERKALPSTTKEAPEGGKDNQVEEVVDETAADQAQPGFGLGGEEEGEAQD